MYRPLVLIGGLLWARMAIGLAQLPARAVSHGVEGGASWPGLIGALLVAGVIGLGLYAAALYRGRGFVAAGTPLFAALTLTAARTFAYGTGPEGLYLVQDGELWAIFVAGSFLLSLTLTLVRAAARRQSG